MVIFFILIIKDFNKFWPKIKEALPELIPVVIKCVMTENENVINLTFAECTKGEKFEFKFQ